MVWKRTGNTAILERIGTKISQVETFEIRLPRWKFSLWLFHVFAGFAQCRNNYYERIGQYHWRHRSEVYDDQGARSLVGNVWGTGRCVVGQNPTILSAENNFFTWLNAITLIQTLNVLLSKHIKFLSIVENYIRFLTICLMNINWKATSEQYKRILEVIVGNFFNLDHF